MFLTPHYIAGKASKAEVISASCVPRKLKNLDEIFHHNKDDYTDCVKTEVKVNKLKPEEIFKTDKEEVRKSNISQKVGKLKLEANIFENQNSGETPSKSPEVKVGKIDAENIFRARTPEPDLTEERRNSVKVGKLTADDLFRPAEEASRELLSICKPGKLSGDQLRISSNIGKTSPWTSRIFPDFNPIFQAVMEMRALRSRRKAPLWFPRARSPASPLSWRAPPGPWGGQRAT